MLYWVPFCELRTLVCFWSLECSDRSSQQRSIIVEVCKSWKVLFFIVSLRRSRSLSLSHKYTMSTGCSNKLECRKVRKPKIEKLRRARINSSLESLKDILLRNTIALPQGSRPTKLEKADILEMTVRYVEVLHEKLSMLGENPAKRPTETSRSPQPWHLNPKRALTDITNQAAERSQVAQVAGDSKDWFKQQQRLYRQSLRRVFDKENLSAECQSMLGEHHWRPWWTEKFPSKLPSNVSFHFFIKFIFIPFSLTSLIKKRSERKVPRKSFMLAASSAFFLGETFYLFCFIVV